MNEYVNIDNNRDDCNNDDYNNDNDYNDDDYNNDDDCNDDNKKIFVHIVENLKKKKLNGGNIESLARNFYEKNMTVGLKKILNKIS